MHVVYIYNLLLSVWHYICCTHGMTENGQETYFALADFAGESRPRKFDRSRIGFESHEDVMVSYDMEIVQDYADRVLVLHEGRLLSDGPARQVLADRELLARASLLPPQIADLALRLGEGFEGVFTAEEMVGRIEGRRSA